MWKKIVLAGAPGAGKQEVKRLFREHTSGKSPGVPESVVKMGEYTRITGNPDPTLIYGKFAENAPAVGPLTDYRKELSLACDRIKQNSDLFPNPINKKHNVVYTHSLLDSVAYPTARLFNMVNSGSVSEDELFRWTQVVHTNALLLRDSFSPNNVIFLRGNNGTEFSALIEESLESVLTQWNIPHESLTEHEDAATMIMKFLLEGEGSNDGAGTELAEGTSNKDD